MNSFLSRFIDAKVRFLRTYVSFLLCLLVLVLLAACSTTGPQAPLVGLLRADPAPAPPPVDPLAGLANFTVADLQAALADATAHQDQLPMQCYPALIQFVQSLPTSNSGTTVIGAFTAFQKARDLRNSINAVTAQVPNYLYIGCGPLIAQVRGDILTLLARLGAGAAVGAVIPIIPIP